MASSFGVIVPYLFARLFSQTTSQYTNRHTKRDVCPAYGSNTVSDAEDATASPRSARAAGESRA